MQMNFGISSSNYNGNFNHLNPPKKPDEDIVMKTDTIATSSMKSREEESKNSSAKREFVADATNIPEEEENHNLRSKRAKVDPLTSSADSEEEDKISNDEISFSQLKNLSRFSYQSTLSLEQNKRVEEVIGNIQLTVDYFVGLAVDMQKIDPKHKARNETLRKVHEKQMTLIVIALEKGTKEELEHAMNQYCDTMTKLIKSDIFVLYKCGNSQKVPFEKDFTQTVAEFSDIYIEKQFPKSDFEIDVPLMTDNEELLEFIKERQNEGWESIRELITHLKKGSKNLKFNSEYLKNLENFKRIYKNRNAEILATAAREMDDKVTESSSTTAEDEEELDLLGKIEEYEEEMMSALDLLLDSCNDTGHRGELRDKMF